MAAHALPGKLYIGPTNATTGGTQLVGIAEDQTTFEDGVQVQAWGADLAPDAWSVLRLPGLPPALRIGLQDVSTTGRQLILSALGTGSNAVSSGGNGTAIGAEPPSVALVIRPRDTGQLYFYAPAMRVHPDHIARLTWSREAPFFDAVVLLPCRPSGGTTRAWMLDTAANINTHYGL